MAESRKMNLALAAVAVAILVASCATFAYTLVPKGDTSKLIVNGKDYAWDALFEDFDSVSFAVEDKGETRTYHGIRIAEIINDTGLVDPEGHNYVFTGSDDYTKTLPWATIAAGYIVLEEKQAIIPGIPSANWVKYLVTIEVV